MTATTIAAVTVEARVAIASFPFCDELDDAATVAAPPSLL